MTVSIEGLADGPLDDVEVMLRGWLLPDAFDRLLARAPRLAWVHSATSGVERALTPAARQRGVVVTNARGVFSRPIAEYVMMMILAVSRRLPQLLELQRERTWQPLEGAELRDVTVGIVGLGSIGRAVACAGDRRSAAASWPSAGGPTGRSTPRRGSRRPRAWATPMPARSASCRSTASAGRRPCPSCWPSPTSWSSRRR